MNQHKIVIAHRGACGYLPEHSMETKAMAYAMGADYIEQDVVLTKDDQLVVLHDHYLDQVSDVAEKFPDRKREDDRFYVIDFTWEEIQQLRITEAFTCNNDVQQAIYPNRFPLWKSEFRIHTLAQEIELIQGLNKSTGKNIGIYPEIKAPFFHQREGKDLSLCLLTLLKQYGYSSKSDSVFLQCFDPNELKRIQYTLFPALDMQLKQVQLIAETDWLECQQFLGEEIENYDFNWFYQAGAMQQVKQYADAISPYLLRLIDRERTTGRFNFHPIIKEAQQAGLEVHPFTFRVEELPEGINNFNALLDLFYKQAGVDGLFTDFPDQARQYLQQL